MMSAKLSVFFKELHHEYRKKHHRFDWQHPPAGTAKFKPRPACARGRETGILQPRQQRERPHCAGHGGSGGTRRQNQTRHHHCGSHFGQHWHRPGNGVRGQRLQTGHHHARKHEQRAQNAVACIRRRTGAHPCCRRHERRNCQSRRICEKPSRNLLHAAPIRQSGQP